MIAHFQRSYIRPDYERYIDSSDEEYEEEDKDVEPPEKGPFVCLQESMYLFCTLAQFSYCFTKSYY